MNDFRAVVLLYHPMIIALDSYAGNDHVALAADLRMASSLDWRIVPLTAGCRGRGLDELAAVDGGG
jgi:hypothetical protein